LSSAHNATARIIDRRRRVAAGRLAAGDLASRIIERRRALAVGRRAADNIAARIVERALLRRGCAGRQRERQQQQQNRGRGIRHPLIVTRPSRPPPVTGITALIHGG
jgi:hypothetical protein